MSRRGYPKNEVGEENCQFIWSYPNGSSVAYPLSATFASLGADKIGANSPGWPLYPQENDYTAWSFNQTRSSSNIRGHDSATQGVADGTYPVTFVTGLSSEPENSFSEFGYVNERARDLCITNLVAKVKNQKINVLQAAAEFKKTCLTVASLAERLANAIMMVKRGNLGGAVSTLAGGSGSRKKGQKRKKPPPIPPNSGSVAKDWLAIQYGWKPMLQDIYGACEELAKVMTYQPPAGEAFAKGFYDDTVEYVVAPWTLGFPPYRVKRTYRSAVKGSVKYRVSSQLAASAANTGITNPAAVVWELVPYSFVVDWFLPVGGYLESLDYHNGLEFDSGYLVTKASGVYTATVMATEGDIGTTHLSWSGGVINVSGNSYQRDILGGFPQIAPPHFKDPVSLKHAANALALLRVAFGGETNRYR